MPSHKHSTLREGLLTGLLGGLVVAVWFFAVDLGRGDPLHTPNVLGQVFASGDTTPNVQRIVPAYVAEYTLLHFAAFLIAGIVLAGLTHLAVHNLAFRMAVWMGLVIAFLYFLGFLFMLYNLTDQRFPWWTALAGSVLGVGSMGLYLWRRHPELRASLKEVPLGAEVRPPPHPREPPRG
jgi:hypothetical protein